MNAKLQLIQNEYNNPIEENDQKRSTTSSSSLTFDKLLKEIEVVRRQVPEICSQYSHQFLSSSSLLSLNQNQEESLKDEENEKSQNLSSSTRSSPIDALLISFLSTVTCHLISSVDRFLFFVF